MVSEKEIKSGEADDVIPNTDMHAQIIGNAWDGSNQKHKRKNNKGREIQTKLQVYLWIYRQFRPSTTT